MDQAYLQKTIRFLKRSNTTCFLEPQIPPSKTDFVVSTLSTRDRSRQQTELLQEYMKNIKFFNELGEDSQRKCVTFMFYQFCQGGEVRCIQFVFHQGDEGSRFYVILTGSVSVLRLTRKANGKIEFSQLGIMRSGDSFGELALINNQPRSASILCREATQFAVLERDAYKRILCKLDDAKLEAKVKLLQKHPAFSVCTKNSLQKMSYFFNESCYRRKQTVFKAGQDSLYVFLVKSGEFELVTDMHAPRKSLVCLSSPSLRARHQQEVTLVGAGEIMGDSEALTSQPYQYTCLCFSAQGELLKILRDDFVSRVANEQTLECFKRLNSIKESIRSERIKKAFNIDSMFSPSRELFSADNSERSSERMQGAKQKLTEAVSSRWGKPLKMSTVGSPRVMLRTAHSSRTLDKEYKSTRTHVSSGKSSKSWVDLVQWKYFHGHRSSGVFLHKLKDPQQNMTARYSKSYTSRSRKTLTSHSTLQMESSQ